MLVFNSLIGEDIAEIGMFIDYKSKIEREKMCIRYLDRRPNYSREILFNDTNTSVLSCIFIQRYGMRAAVAAD